MKSVPYRAYATHNPEEAIKAYQEKTGEIPTVIVVRPKYDVWPDNPLVVFSRFAAANCMLVSHLVLPNEIEGQDIESVYREFTPAVDVSKMTNPKSPKQQAVPERPKGRPANPKVVCPHCQGDIHSFDYLGYWWGWAFGIAPPYWDDLSTFVYRRDEYRCNDCKKKFASAFLVPHHVRPKEDGGTDSAKNLITLCKDCHKDTKPIYDDE